MCSVAPCCIGRYRSRSYGATHVAEPEAERVMATPLTTIVAVASTLSVPAAVLLTTIVHVPSSPVSPSVLSQEPPVMLPSPVAEPSTFTPATTAQPVPSSCSTVTVKVCGGPPTTRSVADGPIVILASTQITVLLMSWAPWPIVETGMLTGPTTPSTSTTAAALMVLVPVAELLTMIVHWPEASVSGALLLQLPPMMPPTPAALGSTAIPTAGIHPPPVPSSFSTVTVNVRESSTRFAPEVDTVIRASTPSAAFCTSA